MSLATLSLGRHHVLILFSILFLSFSIISFIFLKHLQIHLLFIELEIFSYRGVGYPSLWPSQSCREPLDVSNEFSFKVIDGILSGDNLKFL